jgi:hypothetical protein
LRQHGYILPRVPRQHQPLEPRDPLEEVQVDFKDATTVPADPSGEGKRQHLVEVCNFVDAGTSILLSAQAHDAFREETAFETVLTFLRTYGRPRMLTLDRDPRWVGSSSGRDFPSPLIRLLSTLEIVPNICPPQRPDKNAYVERYHRTYKQECLLVHHPSTLSEVRSVTEQFLHHYNEERPHQGRACGNRPPREACPVLPTLPPLPVTVQPNRWLQHFHQQAFVRSVGSDGCVMVDLQTYYLSRKLAGQPVALVVDAPQRCFAVWQATTHISCLPIKGLLEADEMPFEPYVQMMQREARSQVQRHTFHHRSIYQRSLWA